MLFSGKKYHSKTAEFKLVAACSWIPASAYSTIQTDIVKLLLKRDIDWEEVTSLVVRHGVVGQFCSVMAGLNWMNVPPVAKIQLKQCRVQQAVRAFGQSAELLRLSRLFTEAGIFFVPLKGIFLSEEIYGDPCIRSSVDLDILIHPEYFELAEMLLLNNGYRNKLCFHNMSVKQKNFIIESLPHQQYFNETLNVSVELHWKSHLWTKKQMNVLWEGTEFSVWHNLKIRKLSKEENILFLADHGARHDWQCLKWLSDVAMLMQDLTAAQWDALYNLAASIDLQRVIFQTAMLLESVYGIEMPERIKKSSDADWVAQWCLSSVLNQLIKTTKELPQCQKKFTVLRQALRIKQLKPSTSLFALLKSILITPTDFLEFPLPNYLFFFYFLLRPILWIKRHYFSCAVQRHV